MPFTDIQELVYDDGSYKLGVLHNIVFSIYLMYVTKTAVTTLLFLSLLGVVGQVRKSISVIN